MRVVLLFFLALAASVFLGAFVLIEALDLTVLNSSHLKDRIAEQNVYEKLIASASDDNGAMGPKAFVEIMGPGAVKAFGDSLVDGILAFLRNPAVKEIEVGMPDTFFSPETSLSIGQILSPEIVSMLGQAKIAVQTLLVAKSMSLLLALVFLVVIVLVAGGLSSKLRWTGFALMSSGILAWIFSAAFSSLLSSLIEKNFLAGQGMPPALGSFLGLVLADCASLAGFSGLLLLLCGALAMALSFSFDFFSGGKGAKASEKRAVAEKKTEIEEKEKIRKI